MFHVRSSKRNTLRFVVSTICSEEVPNCEERSAGVIGVTNPVIPIQHHPQPFFVGVWGPYGGKVAQIHFRIPGVGLLVPFHDPTMASATSTPRLQVPGASAGSDLLRDPSITFGFDLKVVRVHYWF